MQWRKQGVLFAPGDGAPWMETHASRPFADQLDDEVWRIYFNSRNARNQSQVGSFDIDVTQPRRLLAVSPEPLLRLGARGAFDDAGAYGDCLVNHAGRKYLYYTGWNVGGATPFRNAIGLALSTDGGRTFVKYSTGPILDRSVHDPAFVASPFVLFDEGVWRMWYLSCLRWQMEGATLKHFYHLKYAESRDGIEWVRRGHVCIDFASPDEYAFSAPFVIRDGATYRMWYSYRGLRYRLGYAESPDGLHWTRLDDRAGLDVSADGPDSEMVGYASVFDHRGVRRMLYNGNGYGRTGVCMATLVEP